MTASNRLATLSALTLLGSLSACAAGMLPLARTTGTTFSESGVQFAVVGQRCGQLRDPDRPNAKTMDATFTIEVGNPTNWPVFVHPDRMVLMVPGDLAVRTTTREATESVAVEGGSTSPFVLHFVADGTTCSQEMRLEPNTALESRGRPIAIAAIRFVPTAPQ